MTSLPLPTIRTTALAVAGLTLALATALGQDAPSPPVVPAPPAEKSEPAALELLDDLAVAQERAREQGKPLLVVALPGWYEAASEKQVRDVVLASPTAREALAPFVTVVVEESVDREVHRRHRLKDRGYPLAVMLSSDGEYLGSVAGLPAADAATAWPRDVAAIPQRHARATELRAALTKSPEDPAILFELAGVYVASGEAERADALLERFERADALDVTGHLGEARYQRLRLAAGKHLAAREFASIQPPCLKWLRRFDAEHARRPEVLLLLANARYLGGDADGAKKTWQRIVDEHGESESATKAKRALKEL